MPGLKDSSTGDPVPQLGTNHAAHTLEQGVYPGEENPSSPTNSRVRVTEDWNPTRITGLTETLISSAPCRVGAIIYNTTSAGTISLRDAAATGGASTPKTAPDATRDVSLRGMRFEVGLTAQGSAAGTDVTILWRPI